MLDLNGKVAIVTGSSRGIGRAIAETLAAAGARVVVSSRKVDACEPVAAGIVEKGGDAVVIPCNVSKKEELQMLVDGTIDHYGQLDVLVCNAATNPSFGPMETVDDRAYEKIMGTNVRSNFWLCNMAIPHMVKQGGGSVTLVASIAGMSGTRFIGVYAMSKAAHFQLARNLAVEWGSKNVRANCIAPGLVKTDFARALWENPQMLEAFNQRTPLGRIGEPDDIAGAAAFLASDLARYITGQCLVVDGGATVTGDM